MGQSFPYQHPAVAGRSKQYSSAYWMFDRYKAVGKLSGGHQAAVMVLAVDDTDTADGNICVVTGSKDHYIKVLPNQNFAWQRFFYF